MPVHYELKVPLEPKPKTAWFYQKSCDGNAYVHIPSTAVLYLDHIDAVKHKQIVDLAMFAEEMLGILRNDGVDVENLFNRTVEKRNGK